MNIEARLMKLEKARPQDTEINVNILFTDPDDPNILIIDGERMTRQEHTAKNEAYRQAGGHIIEVKPIRED